MNRKTIEQIEKTLCSGCGLCVLKCPNNCITMLEDSEGFRYPQIDKTSCIDCGLCLRKCPTTEVADKLYSKSKRDYFCGIVSDTGMLLKSSSGGVFGTLANYILGIGGYVCGCVYNEQMEVVHIVSNKNDEIEKMYGSKYVQSRAEQCYKEIKERILEGKTVLFTGTACQIAALRLYVGERCDNLICVEILCHGVPSPGLFKLYKEHLESKLGGCIKDIKFRDKRRDGWGSEHRTCVIYEKEGRMTEKRPILPPYFSAFFYGLNLRESCYNCRFAVPERISDLTLGDFWGSWAKYGKRFREGISVVSVNTEKGQQIIEKISEKFIFCEYLTEEDAIVSNDNFTHPIKRPVERAQFYRDVFKKGYNSLWKKTYLTKTYRKKTLVSVYGAFVPEKIRLKLHKIREKR